MIVGSPSILPFRNSRGKDRIRKISDPLRCGEIWVPVGYVSDGASIPRLFWSTVGHPFSPLFVRPALIHDIRCEFKVGSAKETHDEFLETLIREGVSRRRAKIIHRAVSWFGTTWGKRESITPADLQEIVFTREWGAYDG